MILFDLDAILRGADSPTGGRSEPFQPHLAVSTVFEQVRPLQERLAQIAYVAGPMHQLAELAKVFEPLREFEMRIEKLAKVLEPMHNFRDRLQQVLKQFTPLQALEQELDHFCAAFCESLSQLVAALEPAATLQDKLVRLAVQFEPAKTLRQEFSALAQSFERRPQGLPR